MTAPTWLPQLRLPDPPDDLQMVALTVKQEAGAEPYAGKLAVAYVLVTRARQSGRSMLDVLFDPYDFSAWNTDSPTRLALDTIPAEQWRECYRAACSAAFGFEPDPTHGADHYLNVATVIKVAGKLPSWFDEAKVTATIGRHTFLRLNA